MDWKGVPITDGTGQQDRQPVALEPGYFDVDELSFENLLALGAGFASSINFYNLANEVEGDWGELFKADEAVAMAEILSTDLTRIESDFLNICSGNPDELPRFMLDLAAKINLWFTRLAACRHQSGELLARKMETIIVEKLAPELHNLCKIADQLDTPADNESYSGFASVWGLGEAGSENPFPGATIGKIQNTGDMTRYLRASFYHFSNSISYLKTTAALLLQQSLESGQHDPAIGLFMVFLKLYEKAQLRLNSFTSRHLDFYYEQILRVGNRDQVPESHFLLFETRAGRDRVRIEKNTEFSAGKDTELNEIVYCADEALLVSDARIESLATLYLQHDNLISPEFELDSITRIKSNRPQLPLADSETDELREQPPPWSLFGAEQPGVEKGTSTDARIGFSIASTVFLLEQGARKIDIRLELEPVAKTELATQISNLLQCESGAEFRLQFGKLFARYLLSFKGCLTSGSKGEILGKAESLLPKHLAQEIESLLSQDWQGLFYKLFKKIFCLKLTTENGWLEVHDYILLPYSEDVQESKTGLRILLSLGQEVEPITSYDTAVHGGELRTRLPVLQCVINPLTNFYPYSIFQNLVIASLQIDVDVSGVRNLQAYNHHGQLDPSTPFQPFGPLPGGNSYFVFGSYELACKQLQGLRINLNWAELPNDAGGFDEFYRGYETRYGNNSFRGRFSTLADGRWMPDDPAVADSFKLFETEAASSRVAPDKVVDIDRLDYYQPIDGRLSESDFKFDLKAMRGFFRLSLAAPKTAFGHGEYTQLLAKILTANARRKKQEPVPNPPYTPTLNGISLAYKASTTIYPALQSDANNSLSETIIHMHPFGVETVFPAVSDKPCFLMPQYAYAGNFFIGLSGRDVSGPLSLLFQLSQDVVQATSETVSLDWFYLASNSWEKLSAEHLLSDTTHGLLASGIITLNLPPDISRGNTVMPGDYFWLRISTRQATGTFSSCYSIQPHALKVSKKTGVNIAPEQVSKRAHNWVPVLALPGIGNIKPAGKAFGGRARERDSERKVRVAERLRHKNRAVLPWDYEQLILERFPEFHKVKCFNSISSGEDAIKPGQVLIVVVPHDETDASTPCAHTMINVERLNRVRDYIKNLCSEFVSVEVRNPLYELIQVRCTVKFADVISEGVNIKRLNDQISAYICPWKSTGYQARFGWSIRQQDIESYIRSLDYVEYVTNFSMLHITADNHGIYSLFDTARGEQYHEDVIRPRYPWSLALPAEKHFIESIPIARSINAEITGVDELAVGSTFIISGNSGNGEEE